MISLSSQISDAARGQGFVLIGFSPLRRLPRERFYSSWLAEGRQGDMAYLAREPERRFDPRRIDPRLRSVVSLGFPYRAPAAPRVDWKRELRGRIAAYALGSDYHDRVEAKARAVAARLSALQRGVTTRTYVDTGPVFEREWASAGGLGWFGKNTNLLNRDHGSYFFLAEIFTDAEFEEVGQPYGEFCGTCRRCLDLCPTGALTEGYLMEPRLCISYLTIEHRGAIPVALRPRLGNWIFGCDICQEVCPWNPPSGSDGAELAPYLAALMALDEAGFRRRYAKTAVGRAKRRGLLRNVAIALGNSGNPEALAPLVAALEGEPEALVRAHAAWALGRLGGAAARAALERQARRDHDGAVRAEIAAALATR